MQEKKLGKISAVRFGNGGYDDGMFGLSVTLDMGGTGVQDFKGTWSTYPEGGRAKYTEQEWHDVWLETLFAVRDIMRDAKVNDVSALRDIPVEVTLDGNRLESWRVLTEVL